MLFEWDENKNEKNKRVHHISFEEARYVFADPLSITRRDYTDKEHRWQVMGYIDSLLLVLVVYTMRLRNDEEVIRIISARKATAQEKRQYERNTWI